MRSAGFVVERIIDPALKPRRLARIKCKSCGFVVERPTIAFQMAQNRGTQEFVAKSRPCFCTVWNGIIRSEPIKATGDLTDSHNLRRSSLVTRSFTFVGLATDCGPGYSRSGSLV
jgi:hypothetical protein